MYENRVGSSVKVILEGGLIFIGNIVESTDQKLVIESAIHEIVEIWNPFKRIVACIFLAPQQEEKKQIQKTHEEKHKERILSLLELKKKLANSEKEMMRQQLKSQTCTGNPVEYDTISVLRSIKNRPSRKGNSSEGNDS